MYFNLPRLALCLALGVQWITADRLHGQAARPAGFLPNILWLTSEDNGLELGCYGDPQADSPNIDALAASGMKYLHAWSNAPVCAPARTTIITGMYPTSLGAQHMRSAVRLPEQVQLYPTLLRELGYYCTNNSKTDYNLQVEPKRVWNDSSPKAHWRNRKAGQPFFAVFNSTISHESQIRTRPHRAIHDPAKVSVPPYHPDTPEVRQDWAQYYDRVTEMDRQVGDILAQLEADGLADSTIVFYYGDHGSGMPRGKRWLYESGLRVPLIVRIPSQLRPLIPGDYQSGGASERLVSFVDLVPTLLSLVGLRPPEHLQGHAFLGKYAVDEPAYLYGFRDRMDERYDMSRAVRDQRYSYIRNFMPHRPQGTFLAYMFQTPTTRVWKQMYDDGVLDQAQSRFWQTKAAEELYDLENDPHQIHNLAADPAQAETLERMRAALRDWMIRSGDLGLLPEGEMLQRAGQAAPHVLGHDRTRFPLERILSVAELASDPHPGDLPKLLESRVALDSAERFWVAGGLLLRALLDQDRQAAVQAARGMANDSSAYVRSLANETIVRFGAPADRTPGIKGLLRMSDPRQDGTLAALMALNSLDWCEPSAAEVARSLDGLPPSTPDLPDRYASYIPRMIERIQGVTSSAE